MGSNALPNVSTAPCPGCYHFLHIVASSIPTPLLLPLFPLGSPFSFPAHQAPANLSAYSISVPWQKLSPLSHLCMHTTAIRPYRQRLQLPDYPPFSSPPLHHRLLLLQGQGARQSLLLPTQTLLINHSTLFCGIYSQLQSSSQNWVPCSCYHQS